MQPHMPATTQKLMLQQSLSGSHNDPQHVFYGNPPSCVSRAFLVLVILLLVTDFPSQIDIRLCPQESLIHKAHLPLTT